MDAVPYQKAQELVSVLRERIERDRPGVEHPARVVTSQRMQRIKAFGRYRLTLHDLHRQQGVIASAVRLPKQFGQVCEVPGGELFRQLADLDPPPGELRERLTDVVRQVRGDRGVERPAVHFERRQPAEISH